jgi:hypothetical protein
MLTIFILTMISRSIIESIVSTTAMKFIDYSVNVFSICWCAHQLYENHLNIYHFLSDLRRKYLNF